MARLLLGKTFLDTRPSTRCGVFRSMVIATLTLLMDPSPWYDNISYPPETPGEIPLAARATPLTRGSRRNRGFRGIIPTLLSRAALAGISRLRSRLPDRA